MPWTYATAGWRTASLTRTAVPVARARSAGMAILGKTKPPRAGRIDRHVNTLFPPTNPWRDGITPGGSSGGSAAAVAAGMRRSRWGGHGGSIRIPASSCGVVGLRPSPDGSLARWWTPPDFRLGAQSREPLQTRTLFSVVTATTPGQARRSKGTAWGLPIPARWASTQPAGKHAGARPRRWRAPDTTLRRIPWDPSP